jgi:poly(A) polymerase
MNQATLVDEPVLGARLRTLSAAFGAAGRRLLLVGGPVRDRLLGRPVHDYDLTTDAPPEEIKRLARAARPDAVYDVGARFGTIGLVFREAEGGQQAVEITTFRSELYLDETRKPVVAFGTSLEEDLARRDFTINAIAQDLNGGDLIDPYGG